MAAEDAILPGNKRIAEELQKVPKAKGGGQLGKGGNRTQAKSNVGKADTGIKKDTRSRRGGYVRMAVAERREAVEELTGEGVSQSDIDGSYGPFGHHACIQLLAPSRTASASSREKARTARASPERCRLNPPVSGTFFPRPPLLGSGHSHATSASPFGPC